jgi:hypothetical protein
VRPLGHLYGSRRSGNLCPRCGAPLYLNHSGTTESCRAPDARNPLRCCRYAQFVLLAPTKGEEPFPLRGQVPKQAEP